MTTAAQRRERAIRRRARAACFCLLLAIGSAGCGGATLILKQPVSKACEKAGLKGCEPLSEGVLLYVEGDKQRAKQSIKVAASENAPEKLRAFAEGLLLLDKIPGASKFTKPIAEVAEILVQGANIPGGEGGGSAASSSGSAPVPSQAQPVNGASNPGEVGSSGGPGCPGRLLTADSDPSRLLGGVLRPAANRRSKPCGDLAPAE